MAEYYDIQEVMNKLRKSEEEVQGLVKEGKLRQYMDSGKAVFKVEDVDALAEEIVGLDISSFDKESPEETSETSETSDLDIMLEETSEIELEPVADPKGDEKAKEDKKEAGPDADTGPDDLELDIEPDVKQPESEGGFGLSQMGDLTSADTNVGTVGINILSGTGDAYKLTEDTKAETQAADIDELESLDADSNLESFGSGSGLLDLSLQADDTSLGAVLDDILPTGAEGPEAAAADLPADEGMALMEEPEDILSEGGAQEVAEVPAPMGEPAPAGFTPAPVQMVAVAQVDPKSTVFGVMMMLPLTALILSAIVLTAAIQGVMPALVKALVETEVAGFSLIWIIVAGLIVVLLIILLFAAVSGGQAKPKKAKTKKEKVKKEKVKKEKPAKKKRK